MYQVKVNENIYTVDIDGNKVRVNDKEFEMNLEKNSQGQWQLVLPDRILHPQITNNGSAKQLSIKIGNNKAETELKDHYDLLLEKLGMDKMLGAVQSDLKAPMPGLVLEVIAKPGDEVKKGEPILVLEAMKMENVIKAPGDAVIKEIKVSPKQAVEKNMVLVTFG